MNADLINRVSVFKEVCKYKYITFAAFKVIKKRSKYRFIRINIFHAFEE